ncbi:hypothetical protein DL96DRAFT_1702960 [Flagelloscypha sp. PMI_526]|nr:hypothetical protein DL96DRAFT_1702960 [Flagelloscypha sp. PMI_526]
MSDPESTRNSPSLPPELWQEIYRHLCYSAKFKHELLPYLTINIAAYSIIRSHLYHTLLILDSTDVESLKHFLASSHVASSLAGDVKAVCFPWGTNREMSSIAWTCLRQCTSMTRLAIWLDDHKNRELAVVIGQLSCLEVLEINLLQFNVVVSGPNGIITPLNHQQPLWFKTLTELSLVIFDHEPQVTEPAIQEFDLSLFTKLSRIAINTVDPALICDKIIQTCPSLEVLLVFGYVQDENAPEPDGDTFPVADPRVVVYSPGFHDEDVDEWCVSHQERTIAHLRNEVEDDPLDDWGEVYCRARGNLTVWDWARTSILEGKKICQRPLWIKQDGSRHVPREVLNVDSQ